MATFIVALCVVLVVIFNAWLERRDINLLSVIVAGWVAFILFERFSQ